MRIVIDMQACQNDSRFRGIGRYSTGLITALLEVAKDKHEFILLFNGMLLENLDELIGYYQKFIPATQMKIWSGIEPTRGLDPNNTDRRAISITLKEKFIERLSPDVVLMTSYFEGWGDSSIYSIPKKNKNYLTILTCHDLIPLINQPTYLDPQPDFKKYYLNQVEEFATADGYLAVSESSKNELIQYLSTDKNKIISTLEGVEDTFVNSKPTTTKIESILDTKIDDKKIILYSGASDSRKNHLKLIKAYSLLDLTVRKKSLLVFVGILNDDHVKKFKDYAIRCGLSSEELVLTKRITDQEMIDLYSYCYLFVFPSFHEGFGLPALEAMACGAAVIVSNTTSLPEVIGREDLTFDPYNAFEIRNQLNKFLTNPELRNQVAEYCLEHAKTFSWEKSALISLDFIEKLLKEKKAKSLFNFNKREKNFIESTLSSIKEDHLSKNLSSHEKENLALTIIKNFRENRKPRILFDMSILITIDYLTGIQRVVHEVYQELIKNYSSTFEIIPVKVLNEDNLEEIKFGKYSRPKNKQLVQADFEDIRPGDIYLCVDLNHSIASKSNLYRKLRLQGCKTHFIIHDLLPLSFGDNFFGIGSTVAHYNWLKEIAKSNALICVSQSVMNHVDHYLNTFKDNEINPSLQLGWFHLGANFSNSKNTVTDFSHLEKFKNIDFSNPIFIMVGSVEPRKGHFDALEAFTELWDNGYKGSLIIVGGRSWNNELTVDLIRTSQYNNKFLFWPKDVNDDQLAYLYSKSTALISASIGEGFGLPLIEAMQHGTDVIARDIPVFREVTKNRSVYFKTNEDLMDIILNYKNQIKDPNIKYYQTWQESTKQLMDTITSNQYPITWCRDKTQINLPICSEIFDTTVGIKTGDRISTNKKEGLLVWGGYFPLTRGNYELTISGKSFINQTVDIAIAVHKDGVTNILFEQNDVNLEISRSHYDIPEVLAHLEISMPLDASNTELYIRVKETNDLYISSFSLKRISDKVLPIITVSSGKLGTDVGLLVNNSIIESQHKAGLLVHGGYFKLEKGDYHLFIKGVSKKKQTIDILIVYFKEDIKNIVFEKSHIQIDATPLTQRESEILTSIDLSIIKDISDAQIYLMVNDENDLNIDRFYFREQQF